MSGLSRAPQGDPDKQAGPTSVTSSATTSVSYSLRSRSSIDRSLLPPTHAVHDPVPGGSALPDNKLNRSIPAGPPGPHQGTPAVAGSPTQQVSPSDTTLVARPLAAPSVTTRSIIGSSRLDAAPAATPALSLTTDLASPHPSRAPDPPQSLLESETPPGASLDKADAASVLPLNVGHHGGAPALDLEFVDALGSPSTDGFTEGAVSEVPVPPFSAREDPALDSASCAKAKVEDVTDGSAAASRQQRGSNTSTIRVPVQPLGTAGQQHQGQLCTGQQQRQQLESRPPSQPHATRPASERERDLSTDGDTVAARRTLEREQHEREQQMIHELHMMRAQLQRQREETALAKRQQEAAERAAGEARERVASEARERAAWAREKAEREEAEQRSREARAREFDRVERESQAAQERLARMRVEL